MTMLKWLSIEEKAKAYDKAIEKLRGMIPNWERLSYNGKTFLQDLIYIFPELREPKDEKIRKELIKLMKQMSDTIVENYTTVPISDFVAYLEKQGEHANFRNKIQIGDKVTRNEDGVLVNLSQLNRVAKKDEKQGQTFTKKDVDDAYLKGVINTKNETEKQYETTYQIRKDIATFIFNYRGDIKDRAKWMDYLGIKVCLIEKQSEQKPTDKVEPKFKIGQTIVYKGTENIAPTKMTITDIAKGQYWDDNCCIVPISDQDNWKLEKPTAWSEEDENTISEAEVWLDTLCDYLKDSSSAYIPNVRVVISNLKSLKDRVQPQHKQEWSEEDKEMIGNIRSIIERYAFSQSAVDVNGDLCEKEYIDADSWLKNLKDRCVSKSKQEVGSDISIVIEDLRELLCNAVQSPDWVFNLRRDIDILNSLKHLNRWKPSDEQMKQLGWIANQNKDNMIGKELMTLYNDLKKLK